jgi:hypothetical protein
MDLKVNKSEIFTKEELSSLQSGCSVSPYREPFSIKKYQFDILRKTDGKHVFTLGDDYQELYMYMTCSRCKSDMYLCSCHRYHPDYHVYHPSAKPNLDDYDNMVNSDDWRRFLTWGKDA